MLGTEEQLADFGKFMDAGGLKTPENLPLSQSLSGQSGSLQASYAATVESEADYEADGVQSLPDAIQALSGEMGGAVTALDAWSEYIALAADPFDLAQVSQGADVYRKVHAIDNDTPWASLPPITDKVALVDYQSQWALVDSKLEETQALMAEIHESLLPPPTTETDSETGDSVEVETPPIPLTQDQVDRCLALAFELEALYPSTAALVAQLATMISDAKAARLLALDYFDKAVKFTVCSGQMETPSVSEATSEIFSV